MVDAAGGGGAEVLYDLRGLVGVGDWGDGGLRGDCFPSFLFFHYTLGGEVCSISRLLAGVNAYHIISHKPW